MEKKIRQMKKKNLMNKNTRTRALKHANVKVHSVAIQLRDVGSHNERK